MNVNFADRTFVNFTVALFSSLRKKTGNDSLIITIRNAVLSSDLLNSRNLLHSMELNHLNFIKDVAFLW